MSGPELRAGALGLRLAPGAGGSVAGFWLQRPQGRLELMRPLPEGGTDALHSGMFPMLPFANCIRDNRFAFAGRAWQVAPNMPGVRLNFHGSGWRLPWQVAGAGPRTATLVLEADDGVWRYRGTQDFALEDDALAVTLSVTNLGASPMPFSFGLHPWFPRHGDARVQFAARGFWRLTGEGAAEGLGPVPPEADHATPAPLPRRHVNLCYEGWDGQARILWPAEGLALELSADPVLGQLMVHVPADDPEVFCLEPQSNAPCGFDGLEHGAAAPGVHILAPGETLAGRITLHLRPGAPERSLP